MPKCPNCDSLYYTPMKDGRKECIKCGQVFGEANKVEEKGKDILLG